MIKLIVKKCIKDFDNTADIKVRESYCVLGGILGIVCNLILFAVKLIIGSMMGSIAIISDAFNNLSDTGSSAVSVVGAKLSSKKPDKEHPFGHGRFEYISALIVAFLIILVGIELLKTAAEKITSPEAVAAGLSLVVVLLLSVVIKVWMFSYNKYMGEKINSAILLAAARDSLNDVIATSAVTAATLVSYKTGLLWLDGIVGAVVSIIIIKSGIDVARDTVGMLLGTPPKKETVEAIKNIVMSGEYIVGMHDLIVHDYGPGRVMASVHAEVPNNADIVKIHEVIDALEKEIDDKLNIHTVIHMDPIAVDCEKTNKIREEVVKIVKETSEALNIHDFRMTDGENSINLIFDIEFPADTENIEGLKKDIETKLKAADGRYNAVITLDRIF